jgi:hypothetical protein
MPSTNGQTTSPDRVALYMRVSSEEQRDAGTIQTQSDSLTRHAATCGFEVSEVYADDGVSGTIPLHERPDGYWRTPKRASSRACSPSRSSDAPLFRVPGAA